MYAQRIWFHPMYVLEFNETSALLLILCGKHKITLHIDNGNININGLLQLTESSALPLSLLCTATIKGKLTLAGPLLTNLGRLDSLKIKNLQLQFERNILERELNFFKRIAGLEKLVLNGIRNQTLSMASATELDKVLSADGGLVSLKGLKIKFDLFETFRLFWWSQYFPSWKL